MRKYFLLATTLIAAIAIAGVAQAAVPNKQTADITITPKKAGTKKHPKNSAVHVNITTANGEDPQGTPPSPVKYVWMNFPPEGRWNGRFFPHCTPAIILHLGPNKCPKRSLIGKGTAQVWLGSGRDIRHLRVMAFVGPRNKIELYVEGIDVGIIINLEGTIRQTKKGIRVTVPIPEEAREAVPNTKTPLSQFIIPSLKGKYKGHNLIETIGCPRGHKYTITSKFLSEDGITNTVKSTHPCKGKPAKAQGKRHRRKAQRRKAHRRKVAHRRAAHRKAAHRRAAHR